MTYGEHMRNCRAAKNLSMTRLSELSGVSKASINHWEHDRYLPTVSSAALICDVLGISIDEYIGRKI